MKRDSRRYLFDVPSAYRIRIQGRLDTQQSASFACTVRCTMRVRGEPATTTLTGVMLDQASLMSVLTQLYDMGYPLLGVKRLPDRGQEETGNG